MVINNSRQVFGSAKVCKISLLHDPEAGIPAGRPWQAGLNMFR
jgi:hypothetical protein